MPLMNVKNGLDTIQIYSSFGEKAAMGSQFIPSCGRSLRRNGDSQVRCILLPRTISRLPRKPRSYFRVPRSRVTEPLLNIDQWKTRSKDDMAKPRRVRSYMTK